MIPVAKLLGIKASNGKAWGKWLGQGLGGFLVLPLEMTHRVSEKWSRVRSAVWYKLRHGDMILKKLEMRIEKCGLRKVRTKHWEASDCREFDQGSWVTRDCRAAKSPCFDSWNLVNLPRFRRWLQSVLSLRLKQICKSYFPGLNRRIWQVFISSLWPKSTQCSLRLTWCFLRFSGSFTLCSDLVFVFKIWTP
jgi:hypothetical protein